MEKFKSFITEEKEEKYKVVVLTRQPKDKPEQKLLATARKFEEAAKSLKMESYIVFIEGAYISFVDGVRRIHNVDDEEGFDDPDERLTDDEIEELINYQFDDLQWKKEKKFVRLTLKAKHVKKLKKESKIYTKN